MAEDARLRAVVRLAQAMAAAQSSLHTEAPGRRPREVARAAASAAMTAMDASFAAVSMWERAHGRLRVLANVGGLTGDEEEYPEDESYPVADFPEITEVLPERWSEEAPAWTETRDGPRPGAGPYRRQRVAGLRRRGRGSCVVAPIVLHGRAWGELYLARGTDAPAFGRDDTEFATVLAAVAAAGVAQYERLEEVRRLAFTDPLTGLANRRAVDLRLDEGLERNKKDGTVVSLAVCDVNGLKNVNDTYGHEAGDRLLERFGAVLSRCAGMLPGTLAARLGGDEFCLLSVGDPADEVSRMADEVCRRAAVLEQGEGVACGLAFTGEAPAGTVDSARWLFRLADAAQYRAKATGARRPVVAGQEGGADDPVVRMAAAAVPPRPGERRRFRGG